MPENNRSSGVWDSKECALLLIDYQPGVMSFIRSHDRKLVELNARYLTKAALAFDIPRCLADDPGRRRAEYDPSDDHGMVSRLGRAAGSRRARGRRAFPQGNSHPAEHLSSLG